LGAGVCLGDALVVCPAFRLAGFFARATFLTGAADFISPTLLLPCALAEVGCDPAAASDEGRAVDLRRSAAFLSSEIMSTANTVMLAAAPRLRASCWVPLFLRLPEGRGRSTWNVDPERMLRASRPSTSGTDANP
jgi:hypothetical protein